MYQGFGMRIVRCMWFLILLNLVACSQKQDDFITLAINPWPGYEPLYLAEQKGFFEELGLPIKLVQFSSLSAVQRAYVSNRVDGLASTMIEAVQAAFLGGRDLRVVLVTDYSNGGDVIIADKSIASVADLKGKKLGCEVSSLGIYIAHRALAKFGLSLDDVELIDVGQLKGEQAMVEGRIDAYVTYPPTSVNLLNSGQFHTIFSSADIPYEIIDTVALSATAIEKYPNIVKDLRRVWGMALDYIHENPEESYRIMAERERITPKEFEDTLDGLVLLGTDEQRKLFAQPQKLSDAARDVCNILVRVGSLVTQCRKMPDIIYMDKK